MTNRKALAQRELETRRAWKRLFLTDAGALTEDGLSCLKDMEALCFGTATTARTDNDGRIDPMQMAINEGKRAAFMAVKKRILEPLEPFQRVIEKESHE